MATHLEEFATSSDLDDRQAVRFAILDHSGEFAIGAARLGRHVIVSDELKRLSIESSRTARGIGAQLAAVFGGYHHRYAPLGNTAGDLVGSNRRHFRNTPFIDKT